MTGPAGNIVMRPHGEEPIEHEGVLHFFASSLADLDPFVGYFVNDGGALYTGWPQSLTRDFNCSHLSTCAELLDPPGGPSRYVTFRDDLVLWPDDRDIRERLMRGRRFRDVGPRDGR